MDKLSRKTLQKTMQFLSLKGYKVLSEFALPNKKRVDIIAINLKKEIIIVEVKSNKKSITYDKKWKNYLNYCNYFYFACNEKLQDLNFYAAFEQAVTVYGNEVYAYQIKENYLALEGANTSSFDTIDINDQNASILVWASDTGYSTYASTEDNIPIPPDPPEIP